MWDLSRLVSAGFLDLITEGLAEFYQGNKILLECLDDGLK